MPDGTGGAAAWDYAGLKLVTAGAPKLRRRSALTPYIRSAVAMVTFLNFQNIISCGRVFHTIKEIGATVGILGPLASLAGAGVVGSKGEGQRIVRMRGASVPFL